MDLVKVIRQVQRRRVERERTQTSAFCPVCQKQTRLVNTAEAVRGYQFTSDEITQYVADKMFHRVCNAHGEILFCEVSLRRAASELQTTQPLSAELLQNLNEAF